MRFFEVIEEQMDDAELALLAKGEFAAMQWEKSVERQALLDERAALLDEVVVHGFDRDTFSQLPTCSLKQLKAAGFAMDEDMAMDFFE